MDLRRQGLPDRRTVDYWVGENKAERQPQSRTHVSHNKATGHEKRLAVRFSLSPLLPLNPRTHTPMTQQYLVENFRYSLDTEGYIYATQILQSEAVASAYRVWRRNWKGRGKEYSAGVLVWQVSPPPLEFIHGCNMFDISNAPISSSTIVGQ